MASTLVDIILLSGAIAWLTTVAVYKDGPFKIILKFRYWLDRLLGGASNNPLNCTVCASFWIGLVLISLFASGDEYLRALIQFFGVIGVAMALRGQSQVF